MPVGEALFKSGETTLLIVGLILWVRALVRGQAQQWLDAPSRLPAWPISWGDFLLLPFIVLILLLFVPFSLAWVFGVEPTHPPSIQAVLLGGIGMGIAFIGGTLLFRQLPGGHPPEGHTSLLRCGAAGLMALVYFLPPCAIVAWSWQWVLDAMNMPHEVQEIITVIRDTSNPAVLALWFIVVVIVAPVGEELVFRAGLFRFLANRMRPALAAAISALVFALLHANIESGVPLFVLGLVLAGVYQKTGRIFTAIVLHAAFNLNTLLGLMSGALK